MKQLCDFYIARARLVGALYGIVPVGIFFAYEFISVPFREVYLLRLAISVIVGGVAAAYLNDYGVKLWIAKHRSPSGPGTAVDGMVIGAGVGIGCCIIPPLTMLISTNHMEEVKAFIILIWLTGIFNGIVIGGTAGAIGARHVERSVSGGVA